MKPEHRAKYPELSPSIMNALSRLFAAESEMIAVEKGMIEKASSFPPVKVASIYKDVITRLDEATNFFEDSLKSLTSDARSNFRLYYLTFCRGMKTYYEVTENRLIK